MQGAWRLWLWPYWFLSHLGITYHTCIKKINLWWTVLDGILKKFSRENRQWVAGQSVWIFYYFAGMSTAFYWWKSLYCNYIETWIYMLEILKWQQFSLRTVFLKVSKFQNEFMKSSFLPKCELKIVRICALQCGTVQGRIPYSVWYIFWEKGWPLTFILKFTDKLFKLESRQLTIRIIELGMVFKRMIRFRDFDKLGLTT